MILQSFQLSKSQPGTAPKIIKKTFIVKHLYNNYFITCWSEALI